MPLVNIESVWQYQSASNSVPTDLNSVTIPSSGWLTGLSPFGQGTPPVDVIDPKTVWTKATGLWIRRFLICQGEKELLIKGRCEQAAFIFWDGIFVGSINPQNNSREDTPEYRVIINKNLATSGSHEISILCLDDSGSGSSDFSYISTEVDYLPVVFPFQPQSPVLERLSWVTDVAISFDGSEERKKLSLAPRQEFKFTFPTSFENTPKAQNILWGDLRSEILFPIWTQGVMLNSVNAGLTTINVDTRYSEFRAPGFAMIWSSHDKWQIVGVYEMTPSSITFSNKTVSFSKCWIIPIRTGVLTKGLTKESNGYSSSFELEFMIRDNSQVVGSDPTQYLSNDLYLEETLLTGETISEDMKIDLDIFDPGLGEFSFITGLQKTRSYRQFRVFCEDSQSSWALREFLNRRSGRYRAFRQPSFQNDLRIVNSGLITNILEVMKDEYMRSSQLRNSLAIETSSGWMLREIVSVSSIDSDRMSIQINANLNIQSKEIIRASWLGLKRLDTDVVEINHIGAGKSDSSFLVVEI